MSNAPFYVTQHRQGRKFGNQPLLDGLIHDGLRDFETGVQMGDLALAWGGTRFDSKCKKKKKNSVRVCIPCPDLGCS